ncbi:MAG: FecR domain-containing protein [Spirochaetales bacterium]|nr:FecR domain-containing protein [Spirochaetales bacterium]
MKKRILFITLILLFPMLIFSGGQSEAVSEVAVTAVVEYFDGDVTINDESADFGMKVPFGAVVTTGPGSYCEIVFNRKNIFRIQESTIAEIRLSPSSPEITIKKGTFAALFTKLEALTMDEPFKIRTQTAVAGVRGTAFFVKALDADNTYICICNGELEVTDTEADSREVIESGHHKAIYFRNVNGETVVDNAPMLYHTDEDMEALAFHIDEKIKWYYGSSGKSY